MPESEGQCLLCIDFISTVCLSPIGALPVFPSTYPGTPSPPILESPDCSTGNESSLIDCPASGSSLGSIPRSASISIVGVKCDGEFRHT